MANSDGIVQFNPADALDVPEGRARGEKRVLAGNQVVQALDALDLLCRLILRLAAIDGLRPGEIFAIRLGKIGINQVLIDQRVYSGKFDRPKGRKGKNTSRVVALSPGTMLDIATWRSFLVNQTEDGFLFPSEKGTTPIRPNNFWKRQIQPQLRAIRIRLGEFPGTSSY